MGDSDDTIPTYNDIMSAARRWYYSEIRSLADDIIRECNSECEETDEDSRREWILDRTHETVDGHEFVIYTGKASLACAASDREDAYEDAGLENPTVEQRCYFAMRQDLAELVDARSDEWIPSEDEDEDSEDAQPAE